MRPELAIDGKPPQMVTPGTGVATAVRSAAGKTVQFVVLTPEQGRSLYVVSFSGRERAVLSKDVVLADGASLRVQSEAARDPLNIAFFPPLETLLAANVKLTPQTDGIFSRFTLLISEEAAPTAVAATLETPAGPKAGTLKGTDEETWKDAAVYKLAFPPATASRWQRLDLHYVGDAARLYVDGRFCDDNFYNGDPMSLALWRIPAADQPKVRLKILPFSDALLARLPEGACQEVAKAKSSRTLDRVTGNLFEIRDMKLSVLP